jgi:hypothetical protein
MVMTPRKPRQRSLIARTRQVWKKLALARFGVYPKPGRRQEPPQHA